MARPQNRVARVHFTGPDGDYVSPMTVGVDISEELYTRAVDPDTGDLYGLAYYDQGIPQKQIVPKSIWEQARAVHEWIDGRPEPEPDRTPLTIGACTDSGVTLPLLPRDTPIPATRSFSLPVPPTRPEFLRLELVQGERAMASDNRPLATVILRGLARLAPGATVSVTLTVGGDGMFNITAAEGASQSPLQIEIVDIGPGLCQNDCEALVRWAAHFRESDEALRSALLGRSGWLLE